MVNQIIEQNATDLFKELRWFQDVMERRSGINSGNVNPDAEVFDIPPPDMQHSESSYAQFVLENKLNFAERFLLFMAMIPQIKPECLDIFLVQNSNTKQIFTEFGGRKGKVFNGFLPTAETFLFVLAGNNLSKRFELIKLFDAHHLFFTLGVLESDAAEPGDPFTSLPLQISRTWFEIFTTGEESSPRFSTEFPAQLLKTELVWEDLVLPDYTFRQLQQIEVWLSHHETLLNDWEMKGKIKPGFRGLFYGPPGTGKSLAASLIGKKFDKPVYRIDLSKIISKFIGETEKNLSKVFDRAENKGWILFFDEADALFGKRTSVSSANDRYANQETSYLLQRVEDYNGLVILASNFKNNMDDAFIRRFQAVVDFPMPGPQDRLRLWKKSFSVKTHFEEKLDLKNYAQRYEIPGGVIMNIVQYSSLQSLKRGENIIRQRDVLEGIKKELRKSGRTL